jgi:glycosyltransferase involved in cell wall biosynthesis
MMSDSNSRGDVIRICQVNEYYPPIFAGAGIRHHQLSSLWKAFGIEKEVFTVRQNEKLKTHELMNGVEVFRVSPGLFKNKLMRELVISLNLCKLVWKRRKHYELVHSFSTSGFRLPVFFLAKLLGKPVVLEFVIMRSDEMSFWGKLIDKISFWGFRCLDAYICVSTPLKKYIINRGLSRQKSVFIPNGTFPNKFKPLPSKERKKRLRAKLGLRQDGYYLVFVGSFIRRKGCDVLIDMMEKINRLDLDREIHLIVVGNVDFPSQSDNHYFVQQMKRRIKDADMDAIIHFTGKVERSEVPRWLQVSDVFIFPSRREGMALSILEAMAAGLPCVCSDLDEIVNDVINPGVSGFIINRNDPVAFADQVIELAENPPLRDRVGSEARKVVVQKFDEKNIARRIRTLFDSVVQ